MEFACICDGVNGLQRRVSASVAPINQTNRLEFEQSDRNLCGQLDSAQLNPDVFLRKKSWEAKLKVQQYGVVKCSVAGDETGRTNGFLTVVRGATYGFLTVGRWVWITRCCVVHW